MRIGSGNILGLAISEREIACAEVGGGAGKRRVRKLAHFAIPAGTSLEQPEPLGAQLAEFLKTHGFTASRAVVGIPARWVVAQQREVPPADEDAATAFLRLAAERVATSDGVEMVFDAAGAADTHKPTRVLLMGMPKRRLDLINKFCIAAHLRAEAIVPTSIVLSNVLCGDSNRALVMLSRQGSEVVVQFDGTPRLLRHLAGTTESAAGRSPVAVVGSELNRTFALVAGNGTAPRELVLWEDFGLSPEDVLSLAERLGSKVKTGHSLRSLRAELDPRALNGAAERVAPDAFLPAAALAVAAGDRTLPVNFLDSRLAAVPAPRIGRATLIGSALTVLVLVSIASLYMMVIQRETDAAQLDAHLKLMAEDIKSAESRLARISYGRGYFQTRPAVLDCLREVTLSLRPDEPLWMTSFTLRDTGRGQLQGKSTNQQIVLALLDRLKGNAKFTSVQLQDMRESTGASREIAFSMSFSFAAREASDAQ